MQHNSGIPCSIVVVSNCASITQLVERKPVVLDLPCILSYSKGDILSLKSCMIHSTQSCSCLQVTSHLVAALAEAGKPTLLIGPSGCGKSHIIKDRLISNSSDMAEVQSLFINANKFITAKTLWQRMDDLLEWKHTKTFVPKGNKRLICLIDDINYCHVSIDCTLVSHINDRQKNRYKDYFILDLSDTTALFQHLCRQFIVSLTQIMLNQIFAHLDMPYGIQTRIYKHCGRLDPSLLMIFFLKIHRNNALLNEHHAKMSSCLGHLFT